MKKCASCSKDLPDAALHCVFCGAKQAPAPAQQPGLQKTVMGYSAQEMLAQMRAQGVPPGTPGAPPQAQPPQPQPVFQPPPPAPAVYQPPPAALSPALAPPSSAGAPTMFDQSAASRPASPSAPPPLFPPVASPIGGAPRGSVDATLVPQAFQPHAGSFQAAPVAGSLDATLPPAGFPQGFNAATEARAQAQALGLAPHAAPPASTPLGAPVFGPASGPIPQHPVSPAAAMVGNVGHRPQPVRTGPEPMAGLRMWSLVFGILILIAFILPVSLDPLRFPFTGIGNVFDGSVRQILALLLGPSIGLIAIVCGAIPMPNAARGAIVGLLAVSVFALPYAFDKTVEWQALAQLFGPLVLLIGLAIRGAYSGSILARILVTLGALATLAPLLVPGADGNLPLVTMLQGLADAKLASLVGTAVELAVVVLTLASLLAWLPRTSSGGAAVFYWTILLLIAIGPFLGLALEEPSMLARSPALAFSWASVFAVYGLASYGLGALLGKLAG